MLVECPHCRTEWDADERAGSVVECPRCRREVELTALTESIAEFLDDDDQAARRPATKTCPMCGVKNRRSATKCRSCGEAFAVATPRPEVLPSPLGLISFGVALLAVLVIFASFALAAFAGLRAGPNGQPQQAELMLVGLGIIAGLMIDLVGTVLGYVALFLPGRSKVFAAIGAGLGTLMLVGVLVLIGIGLAMQNAPMR